MKVAVEYLVPVLCWVDTEAGVITGVSEHAELIEQTGKFVDEDGEYIPAEDILRAVDIAENTDWPEWERI